MLSLHTHLLMSEILLFYPIMVANAFSVPGETEEGTRNCLGLRFSYGGGVCDVYDRVNL